MKHILALLLLFSFSAFAGDYCCNSDFERKEIRLSRDRGETKDYGGYWAPPAQREHIDVQAAGARHQQSLDSMINSGRRPYPY